MKKKIISILFVAIIILSFTGCSKDNENINKENALEVKATVINNKNETEQLSSKEIINIIEENQAKFAKYYAGAKISFNGTVESIEVRSNNCLSTVTSSSMMDSGINSYGLNYKYDERSCYVINFKEGYKLRIPEGNLIDVADINKGDKYYVESNIFYVSNEMVSCFGINDNKSIDFDITKMSKAS